MVTRMIFDNADQDKSKNSSPVKQEQPVRTEVEVAQVTSEKKPESFYVLENDFVQLVFSSKGGALAEINLSFKSESNPKSFVLPIGVDSALAGTSPQNARFPLHPAKTYDGTTLPGTVGGYYPLIRRDIVGNQPHPIPAKYYSCNIVSEFPELAEMSYEVTEFSKDFIVFQSIQPHRRITKRFTLPQDPDKAPYCFTLEIKIEGPSQGLWLTSGVPEIEWQSGASASVIKYRISRGSSHEVVKIDLPSQNFVLSSSYPDWVCNSNGFFGLILDPLKGQESGFKVEKVHANVDPTRLHLIDQDFQHYGEEESAGYNVLLPLKTVDGQMSVRVFSGPFAEKVLETVDEYYAPGNKSSDYLSCQTFHGWFAFISEPFAKFLFFLMKFCYSLTGSWALSIVFVTLILRILLYPLNSWSMRSMKHMQEIGPQIKAIQERYKKEPQKAQMEIMQLYRSKGVNPISGCLPLLLQLPFLIGMFDLLKSTFELRGAVFIPGWIDDLTAPDVLFSWHTSIPLIGNEFHLLPVLLGVIMYVQQNVMSNLPKDSSQWTEQQRQSRVMGNIMTVVMTVLFYNFPSGLNIYWISSMLLGMVQQWWVTRSITEDAKAKATTVEIEVTPKATKHKK
jgi:YidC/Oxa1 family membrane protein insertase